MIIELLIAQPLGGLALAICVAALIFGRTPERIGAGTYLVAWIASLLIVRNSPTSGPYYAMAAVDAALLVVFVLLCWKARSSWPVWAAALQAVNLAIHGAYAFDLRIGERAYFAAITVATWGVLAALTYGTWHARWGGARA